MLFQREALLERPTRRATPRTAELGTSKPQSFCSLAEEEQKQKDALMNTLKLALEIRESTDFFVQMVQINGYRVSTRTVLVNTSNYTIHTCSYAPMWN